MIHVCACVCGGDTPRLEGRSQGKKTAPLVWCLPCMRPFFLFSPSFSCWLFRLDFGRKDATSSGTVILESLCLVDLAVCFFKLVLKYQQANAIALCVYLINKVLLFQVEYPFNQRLVKWP